MKTMPNSGNPIGGQEPRAKSVISAFFTLIVVGLLLMSGPANAFTASISVNNPTPNLGEPTVFTALITKVSDEVINTIELKVGSPGGIVFDAEKISCSPDYAGQGSGFGYGIISGYGYSPNFGYGYGYGYENSGVTSIVCTFEYIPISAGNYSAQVFVNSQPIGNPSSGIFAAVGSTISNPVQNTVYTPTTNSQITFTSLPPGNFTVSVSESTSIPAGTSTTGFETIGIFYEITSDLANGSFSTTLVFSYSDTDNDGIVDGTGINENSLNAFFWNGSQWALIPNPVRDTLNNTVTVTVDHFTSFSLMNQTPAPPTPSPSPPVGGTPFFGGVRGTTTTPATPQAPTTPAPIAPPATPTPPLPPATQPPATETGTEAPATTIPLPPATGLATAGNASGLAGLVNNTNIGMALIVIALIITVFGVRSTWLEKKK